MALAGGGIRLMVGMAAGASTAAPAAASPAVENCGTGAALTQPGSLILICADHRRVAGHLNWPSWAVTQATATATVIWAEGATWQDSTTADITLSEPVTHPDGTALFTELIMHVTGSTPSGFVRTATFNEAPVPARTTSPAAGTSEVAFAGGTRRGQRALNTAAIGGDWELAGGPSSEAEIAEAITGAEAAFEPGTIHPGMSYSTTGRGLWPISPRDSLGNHRVCPASVDSGGRWVQAACAAWLIVSYSMDVRAAESALASPAVVGPLDPGDDGQAQLLPR